MINDEAGIAELAHVKGSGLDSVIFGNFDKNTVSAVYTPAHNEICTYSILSVSAKAGYNSSAGI
jgi:hypothetical protein